MVDGGESKRQAGQDALRLDVGEGVNGPVPLRPSHSLLLFRPNWLFFFFPWNHLSSPSLLRLSIFSRTPNEFYTHVSICTSEEQWASKEEEEEGKTEWTEEEYGGVGVVGFWGPAFESVLWLGPHVPICMCESAFLLVTQWETPRCVCVLFCFSNDSLWNSFQMYLWEESHD